MQKALPNGGASLFLGLSNPTNMKMRNKNILYLPNMEIKINNKTYPLFFSMLTIEQIMTSNKMIDFDGLQGSQNVAESMKFARDCAFYGIASGLKKEGKKSPFHSSEEIGEVIESFEELQPALDAFTESVTGFFQKKEAKKK